MMRWLSWSIRIHSRTFLQCPAETLVKQGETFQMFPNEYSLERSYQTLTHRNIDD